MKDNKNIDNFINCGNFGKKISNLSKRYLNAKPFSNIVIDDFLKEKCIYDTLEGFKKVNWASYNHFNEKDRFYP